jgi:hypothetical protein
MPEHRETRVVRLPDETVESLKFVGRLKGLTPGDMMAEAWEWWWDANGDRAIDEAHREIEALRPSTIQGSDEKAK